MNEEKESIGQFGIDTEQERAHIQYRPNLQWQRPDLRSEWKEQSSQEKADTLYEFIKPKTLDLWNSFLSVWKKLGELEKDVATRLHDTFADIPEHMREDVQKAASKYGYIVEDKIPFNLYQFALRQKDSLEKQLIMDVYEAYHADVYGSLLAELYPDIVEMQHDWDDIFGFLNKGVFAQLVHTDNLPKEASEEDTAIKRIVQEETNMGLRYKTLLEETEHADEFLRTAYLHNVPDEELMIIEKDIERLKRGYTDIERRMYTKQESIELSDSKARRALTNLSVMEYAIDIDHYKGERKSILMSLLKPYVTGQAMEKGLRKIQALLKLSVDGKNGMITDMKMNLRNLSGRENRKRINGALVHGIHLRNEVGGEVLDVMGMLEDKPELPGFSRVAGHIMDSVAVSRELFQDNASDFYKMHTMESEIRLEKVSGLIEKDSAREIYKLLDAMIVYGQERNSWPTERDLFSWIDNFLASQKIS